MQQRSSKIRAMTVAITTPIMAFSGSWGKQNVSIGSVNCLWISKSQLFYICFSKRNWLNTKGIQKPITLLPKFLTKAQSSQRPQKKIKIFKTLCVLRALVPLCDDFFALISPSTCTRENARCLYREALAPLRRNTQVWRAGSACENGSPAGCWRAMVSRRVWADSL